MNGNFVEEPLFQTKNSERTVFLSIGKIQQNYSRGIFAGCLRNVSITIWLSEAVAWWLQGNRNGDFAG